MREVGNTGRAFHEELRHVSKILVNRRKSAMLERLQKAHAPPNHPNCVITSLSIDAEALWPLSLRKFLISATIQPKLSDHRNYP